MTTIHRPCKNCGSREIAIIRSKDTVSKVRCFHCGHTVVVNGTNKGGEIWNVWDEMNRKNDDENA